MTTAYTSLLGLALPITGELSGTWGDTVNNSITSLLDSAVAGTTTITADTTLSTTTGAANQARQAILLCSPASANITITAPAQSKIYTVINTSGTYTVKICGVGPTTGVTLAVSESAVVAWNGTDFIRISSNTATTGNFTVNGNLSVTGNTTLGDASADTVTVNGTTTFNASPIISVTDNTNAALRITQLGTGNALLVEDSTNPDATPFVIDATGRVLVGATSTSLTVSNDAGQSVSPQAVVLGTGLSSSSSALTSWSSTANVASTFALVKSKSGTIGTNGIVASGDALGRHDFIGDDGASFITAAAITAFVDGTPGTNDMPGRLVFSTTADGASTPTERMRIDSAGNVGIGSTSLTGRKVVVSGTVTGAVTAYGIYDAVTFQSDVTTHAYGIRSQSGTQAAAFTLPLLSHYAASQGTFGATSAVTTQYGFNADSSLTGATNNYGFYGNIASGAGRYNFYAAGTADNYFAGNVGIGTSSPAVKLDVNGITGWGGATTGQTAQIVGASSGIGGGGNFRVLSNTTQAADVGGVLTLGGYYTSTTNSIDFGAILGAKENSTGGNTAGYLAFGTRVNAGNMTERMRIDSSGNLLVGTTSNNGVVTSFTGSASGRAGFFMVNAASSLGSDAVGISKFDNNTTTSQVFVKFFINNNAAASGLITASGANQAAFTSSSDSRLKENIVDLSSQLANIMALRPVEFDYIESEGGGHQIGFIAQEVQEIYPDVVGTREDGMLLVSDFNKNDARLIKAIQEQQALITALTARITALETP